MPKLFILLFICTSFFASAQAPKKIRFAKDKQYIYFFQVAQKHDTLRNPADFLFYYLVPDSLKAYIILQSENASFVPLKNDSIVKCNYIPGIRYETFYSLSDGDLGMQPSARQGTDTSQVKFYTEIKKAILRCGTNGAAVVEPKKIVVNLVDKRSGRAVLHNTFYLP